MQNKQIMQRPTSAKLQVPLHKDNEEALIEKMKIRNQREAEI